MKTRQILTLIMLIISLVFMIMTIYINHETDLLIEQTNQNIERIMKEFPK